MTITFSMWGVLTIISYAVIVLVAINGFRRRSKFHWKSTRSNVVTTASAFLIPVIILNVAYIGFSSIQRNRTFDAPNRVVAERLFGFKAETEYPLILGGQTSSFTAKSEVHSGFFSAIAITQTSGGPAITASFTHGQMTYTLSLPRSSTPIEISNSAQPSMLVRFMPGEWDHTLKRYRELSTVGAQYPQHWSDCEFAVADFATGCQRIETVSYSDIVVSNIVREAGLGKLIEHSFASAKLVMTQSMYDQLIGRITPAS